MDRQDRKGLAPSASGMPRADEPLDTLGTAELFIGQAPRTEWFPQTFNRIQAAEGGPYSVSDVFQQSQQSTSAPSSTYSSAPPTQPVRTFRGASTSDSGRSTPAAQSSIRSNLFGQVNVGQPHPGISQGSTHPLRNYYSDSPEVAQAGRNGPPRKIPSDGVDSSATIPRIDRIPEIELPWQAYTHSHGSPPSAGASVPRGSPVAAGSSQVDSSYHQGSSTRYAYSSSAGDMLPGGRDNRIGTNASRSGTLRAHYQAQVALRHPSSSARISSANSSPYYRPHASLQGEVLVPSTWPRVSATAHDVQETRRLASTEMGTSDYTRGVGTRSHALDGGVLRPRVADPMQKVAPSNGVPCTGSHSSPASNGHPPFSIFAANSRDLALANISVHSDDVPLIDENRVPSRDRSSVSETNGISHASTPYFTNLFSPEMGVSATGGVIDDHYSNHPSFPSFLERDETVLPTQAWTQGSHVAGFGVNFDGELDAYTVTDPQLASHPGSWDQDGIGDGVHPSILVTDQFQGLLDSSLTIQRAVTPPARSNGNPSRTCGASSSTTTLHSTMPTTDVEVHSSPIQDTRVIALEDAGARSTPSGSVSSSRRRPRYSATSEVSNTAADPPESSTSARRSRSNQQIFAELAERIKGIIERRYHGGRTTDWCLVYEGIVNRMHLPTRREIVGAMINSLAAPRTVPRGFSEYLSRRTSHILSLNKHVFRKAGSTERRHGWATRRYGCGRAFYLTLCTPIIHFLN